MPGSIRTGCRRSPNRLGHPPKIARGSIRRTQIAWDILAKSPGDIRPEPTVGHFVVFEFPELHSRATFWMPGANCRPLRGLRVARTRFPGYILLTGCPRQISCHMITGLFCLSSCRARRRTQASSCTGRFHQDLILVVAVVGGAGGAGGAGRGRLLTPSSLPLSPFISVRGTRPFMTSSAGLGGPLRPRGRIGGGGSSSVPKQLDPCRQY